MDADSCPGTAAAATDRVICHCFRVTESQIVEVLENHPAATLQTVRQCTKAGGGCTACHGRIRELIRRHQAERLAEAQSAYVGTGASGLPSPICCAR